MTGSEIIVPLRYRSIARVVLEAESPLSIATGREAGNADIALALDGNGLPAIPGSTVAGVMRHLFLEQHGDQRTRELFGGIGDDDEASPLAISWAAIHDSRDRPVEDGFDPEASATDELVKTAWRLARKPVLRDGVRLTHRGTAAFRGRYDRSLLPSGFRFTLELELATRSAPGQVWKDLLGTLRHPAFRLGGATRRGLGKVGVIRIDEKTFDLNDALQRRTFLGLGRGLGDTHGLDSFDPRNGPVLDRGWTTLRLQWTPLLSWRTGQGATSLLAGQDPDLMPRIEPAVTWNGAGGAVRGTFERNARLVLPASGLKGALAHRTAFHHNRVKGAWAEECSDFDAASRDNEAVTELFGQEGRGEDVPARAGRVIIDDGVMSIVPNATFLQPHNSVDRFTGGVRRHLLFFEEAVRAHAFDWSIHFQDEATTAPARKAFDMAMADLVEGRLALGGGAANGHGYGTGTCVRTGETAGPGAQWAREA